MSARDGDTGDERNPHESASRWRHQESSAFARHAAQAGQARDPVQTGDTAPLASFLNSSRIEPEGDGQSGGHFKRITVAAGDANMDGARHNDLRTTEGEAPDGREIVCGPLLNYRRMHQGRWYGSVLVVVKGGGKQQLHQPFLTLRQVARAEQPESNIQTNGHRESSEQTLFESHCLYSDPRNTFWAFDINVPVEATEMNYEYSIPEMRFAADHKPRVNNFFVPAATESMRIMFHSCNGFSVGTDEEAWSGPALWNDVVRKHNEKPWHVMVGGGDQIYNDGIRVDGPLQQWTSIGNPKKRREYPFPEKLRAECDDYYLNNYLRWYNTAAFATMNGQVPQINIWDDHDIIDGFGSYVDLFMRCDVFRGIGGTAHKYYMLFQHHLPPPESTYTSDYAALQEHTQGPDPNQLIDTYVAPMHNDPLYIIGTKPGPYVAEHSYNLYARLGARIALLGIDARTERTRHQVNYPETYDIVFDRLRSELSEAANSGEPIQHLILLLGIPIAYPRLTWLENIFRSPVMGPVKFLNRRFGLGGGLFNHFDGSIDLLDDLDDHYTARTHKKERRELMERLQKVSAEFSVRVTILGGDVHLAALGRFYSNPNLNIPAEEDHRYMTNVISSAIVNKPPPQAVANLLARRNKIHHMNHKTDETLLDLFNKDPGDFAKTANHNNCTMPSRNFASITENSPHNTGANGDVVPPSEGESQSFLGNDGHKVLHKGEVDAGTIHKAAQRETHGTGHDGTLDVCINVEIDQHDPEGRTQMYGLTVPLLRYVKREEPATPPRTATPKSSRSARDGQ
ncbi:Fc.00g067510.m01.CDS01 [Cosmosporella sp. VM-42]